MRSKIVLLFTTLLLTCCDCEVRLKGAVYDSVAGEAFGNGGIRFTGITGDLTAIGKVLVILLMFVGRVGVLTFGFALLGRKTKDSNEPI